MKINDTTIKELLLPSQEKGEQTPYYCVGVIVATIGQAAIFGVATALANTYYILGFTDTKLITISLDMMGKPSKTIILKYKDVKNVKISNWLLGIGKSVQLTMVDNTKIKFKINKIVIGAKITKQSENLEAICLMLKTKFNQ